MSTSTLTLPTSENHTENTPNAAKLLSSLRHLDYSSTSAICDIVDNSIDAGASAIRIKLIGEGKSNLKKIEVWDDGDGMDYFTINQAMRLGSDTDKNPQYDLGRYGMGLVTASISIGELLEVTTVNQDASYIAIQDLDLIKETNKFIIKLHELNDNGDFLTSLQSLTTKDTETGTRIVIGKIDRWQWVQMNASERNLIEAIGQVFRKFISSGRKIYVNDKEVTVIDPIHSHNPELLAEDVFEVEGERIEVKLYEMTDQGISINNDKFNIANQGFYILRNNREISTGVTLGLFSKHNSLNLFRAELTYSGALDAFMGSGFTKQNINTEFNQSMFDKLSSFVTPYIKQVKNRSLQRGKDNRAKKEDFSEIEKFITQKSHLLKTPEAKLNVNSEPGVVEPKITIKPNANKIPAKPRLDITKKKKVDLDALKVKFKTASHTALGLLYTADMEKEMTVITWNIDHPFYLHFIVPNEGNKDVINPICFLVYSLASAELRSKVDSDSEKILGNIQADLSQNLRILMNL